MPAPYKAALDFIHVRVNADLDEDLSYLIATQGPRAEHVYLKLLTFIYGNRGYYTEWTESAQMNFLRRFPYLFGSGKFQKVQIQLSEIVKACLRVGLFDRSAFDSANILTSSTIQYNWLHATYKRVGRSIVRSYWVNDIRMIEETELMTSETLQEKKRENIISIYSYGVPGDFVEAVVDSRNGVLLVLPKSPPGSGAPPTELPQEVINPPQVPARPPATYHNSGAPLPIAQLVAIIEAKGEAFVETVRMIIKRPQCDVLDELNNHFVPWLAISNITSKTETDFTKHFISWLSKQPLTRQNNGTNSRNDNKTTTRADKFSDTEFDIIAELANADRGVLAPQVPTPDDSM